jgi:hypothetical protein
MILEYDLMNFDENEVDDNCESEICFLNQLKKKRSKAERYLKFEGTKKWL